MDEKRVVKVARESEMGIKRSKVMGRIYKCAVKGCRAAASSHQHSFPNPDILPERFQLWLDRIGNEDLQEVPKKTLYRTYRVCQLHFRPEYISRNNRLLRSAVPSENLHATTSQSADMDVSEYVEPSTSQSVEPSTSQATTDPSTETELQGNEASLQAVLTETVFTGSTSGHKMDLPKRAKHNETWYDTHDTICKGWVDNSATCQLDAPVSRGKRIIILHAGSEKGWIAQLLLSAKNVKCSSLDYHEDMTSSLFEEWFCNTLLPNLPESSVIVMDNASYHSRQQNKVPTKCNNKKDIKEFFRSK
ncbi:thap domain [Holotrichia oblita]|uniref:Thap domain n=1 Tax=Holotrichia oblita TaxID=644536 RepID=A0ACB9T3X6_HOLOL|nr:thap domain [Holotrichia oblita]